MRILFNLRDQDRETTKSLGILHASVRILQGLAETPGIERIDVLTNRSLAAVLPASLLANPRCQWLGVRLPAPRRWARLWWDQWSLVRQANALAPDWILLPKGFYPLVRRPKARVSAFIHDNIFEYYRSQGVSPFPRGEASLFRASLRRSARQAALIVTNSNFTRSEVLRDFMPVGKVVRIGVPLGILAGQTCSAPSAAADGAILLPTSIWPHKLTHQAIEWLLRWEKSSGSRRPVHGYGSLPAESQWPAIPHWTRHERLDDPALQRLHARAAILIYFSSYEGYGLPPVEAAAQGIRAIASDLPPLRETMPAEMLFANSDYASFKRTLDHAFATAPSRPLLLENARDVAGRWVAALRSC